MQPIRRQQNVRRTNWNSEGGVLKSWSESLWIARQNIQSAQERQRVYANRRRRDVTFSPGDKVMLNARRLPGWQKMRQPWIGPFVVERVKGPVTYQLDMPEHWTGGNIFHIEFLKPLAEATEAPLAHLHVEPLPQDFGAEMERGLGPGQIRPWCEAERVVAWAPGGNWPDGKERWKVKTNERRQRRDTWYTADQLEAYHLGSLVRRFNWEHPETKDKRDKWLRRRALTVSDDAWVEISSQGSNT